MVEQFYFKCFKTQQTTYSRLYISYSITIHICYVRCSHLLLKWLQFFLHWVYELFWCRRLIWFIIRCSWSHGPVMMAIITYRGMPAQQTTWRQPGYSRKTSRSSISLPWYVTIFWFLFEFQTMSQMVCGNCVKLKKIWKIFISFINIHSLCSFDFLSLKIIKLWISKYKWWNVACTQFFPRNHFNVWQKLKLVCVC